MEEAIAITLVILFGIAAISVLWPPNAPFLPTPRAKVRKMLKLANVGPDDLLYDLGSGDGRTILMAAQKCGARAVGVEIDPLRVFWSRTVIRLAGQHKRVRVVRGDFFDEDLRRATVVTCYLLQDTNDKLAEKLHQELAPGTRIVSHTFTFSKWFLAAHDEKADLYLYIR